jgi:hypothetical protein
VDAQKEAIKRTTFPAGQTKHKTDLVAACEAINHDPNDTGVINLWSHIKEQHPKWEEGYANYVAEQVAISRAAWW